MNALKTTGKFLPLLAVLAICMTLATPAEARFVIRDDGPGFDPAALPDTADPENLLKPSGRGVMLMRTFMDEVTFSSNGACVTMVKNAAADDD